MNCKSISMTTSTFISNSLLPLPQLPPVFIDALAASTIACQPGFNDAEISIVQCPAAMPGVTAASLSTLSKCTFTVPMNVGTGGAYVMATWNDCPLGQTLGSANCIMPNPETVMGFPVSVKAGKVSIPSSAISAASTATVGAGNVNGNGGGISSTLPTMGDPMTANSTTANSGNNNNANFPVSAIAIIAAALAGIIMVILTIGCVAAARRRRDEQMKSGELGDVKRKASIANGGGDDTNAFKLLEWMKPQQPVKRFWTWGSGSGDSNGNANSGKPTVSLASRLQFWKQWDGLKTYNKPKIGVRPTGYTDGNQRYSGDSGEMLIDAKAEGEDGNGDSSMSWTRRFLNWTPRSSRFEINDQQNNNNNNNNNGNYNNGYGRDGNNNSMPEMQSRNAAGSFAQDMWSPTGNGGYMSDNNNNFIKTNTSGNTPGTRSSVKIPTRHSSYMPMGPPPPQTREEMKRIISPTSVGSNNNTALTTTTTAGQMPTAGQLPQSRPIPSGANMHSFYFNSGMPIGAMPPRSSSELPRRSFGDLRKGPGEPLSSPITTTTTNSAAAILKETASSPFAQLSISAPVPSSAISTVPTLKPAPLKVHLAAKKAAAANSGSGSLSSASPPVLSIAGNGTNTTSSSKPPILPTSPPLSTSTSKKVSPSSGSPPTMRRSAMKSASPPNNSNILTMVGDTPVYFGNNDTTPPSNNNINIASNVSMNDPLYLEKKNQVVPPRQALRVTFNPDVMVRALASAGSDIGVELGASGANNGANAAAAVAAEQQQQVKPKPVVAQGQSSVDSNDERRGRGGGEPGSGDAPTIPKRNRSRSRSVSATRVNLSELIQEEKGGARDTVVSVESSVYDMYDKEEGAGGRSPV
ncbi:hypothetical protein HDU76_005665, partial [Blyttiomyces sp. JEL0837]